MSLKTKLRQSWKDMLIRCYNPNGIKWHRYGGRGIKVCDEWKNDFSAYEKWSLENCFADNLTIDRIDVNGDYEPSNCRWTTIKIQANNTSTNVFIEYNGERLTYEQWGDRLGGCKGFIWNRINMGWTPIQAITTPKKRQGFQK